MDCTGTKIDELGEIQEFASGKRGEQARAGPETTLVDEGQEYLSMQEKALLVAVRTSSI